MVRSQSQTSLAFSFGLAAGLLVLFGLLALSSAGAVVGFQKYHDTYYYFKHQLFFGVIPGALAAFLFSRIPYLTWKRWAQPLFVATLVLLVMVLVPGLGGRVISGAKSWFVVSGISFQPTELLKLTLIFFLARWIEQRGAHRLHTWRDGALPFAMIIGIITILIALQPDVGSLILIIAFSSTLFFVGGANLDAKTEAALRESLASVGLGNFGLTNAAEVAAVLNQMQGMIQANGFTDAKIGSAEGLATLAASRVFILIGPAASGSDESSKSPWLMPDQPIVCTVANSCSAGALRT